MSRRSTRIGRPIARRPRVESLERRELLAGLMVSTVADSGLGSLRAAIAAANATPGTATVEIDFAIGTGVQTIAPTSPLPAITRPVFINGASQPGYLGTPLIVLSGSQVAAGTDGLTISGGASTIRGLAIDSFASLPSGIPGNPSTGGRGLVLSGAGGDSVVGSYIGVDPTGKLAAGNGIGIEVDASNVTIGGSGLGSGDVISASTGLSNFNQPGEGDGVFVSGASGVAILGSLIGTDASGEVALPNRFNGVDFEDADLATIGGTVAGAGNVISANGGDGIVLYGLDTKTLKTSNSLIEGNIVGLDAAGAVALPNQGGILVNGANDTIGGTTVPARNIISGNADFGIDLSDGAGGPPVGSAANLIQGNYVGTNAFGTAALANGEGGAPDGQPRGGIIAANGGTIGGTVAGAGNLVSGNVGVYGITASDFTIQGNLIGTDATGTKALGNLGGVSLTGSNTVGGTTAAARNVVSGNIKDGITLTSTSAAGEVVLIEGNYVGVDVSGKLALGNGSFGVDAADALVFGGGGAATIGGTVAGSANVISGNGIAGVNVSALRYTGQVADVSVLGNLIGTDASGFLPLGNKGDGILLGGLTPATIGGTAAGAGNVIAYNGGHGIELKPFTYSRYVVQGNSIHDNAGTQIASSPVVYPAPVLTAVVADGAGNLTISGTFAAAPNTTRTFDFYASPSASAANPGGQTYLGSATATAGADGRGSIQATFPVPAAIGNPPVAQDLITATANVDGGISAFTAAPIAPPAIATADLALTGTGSTAPQNLTAKETFTLTVTNTGANPAVGVTLLDLFPNGGPFLSATSDVGTVSIVDGGYQASLGTLAPGVSATITYRVAFTDFGQYSGNSGPLVSTASVTSLTPDVDPGNNSVYQSVVVSSNVEPPASADLALAATTSPATLIEGAPVTYVLTATNAGPGPAANAVILYVLPAGVTLVSATPSQGRVERNALGLIAYLGRLADGASATLTLVVNPAVSPLVLAASVDSDAPDADFANNTVNQSAPVQLPAGASADLALSATTTPASPIPSGVDVTYVLTATDAGPDNAGATTLYYVLPTGATLVSATPSQGSVEFNQLGFIGHLGTLLDGGSATITIVVNPHGVSPLVLSASLGSNVPDPNTANNFVNQSVTVQPAAGASADLALTATTAPATFRPGVAVTYVLTATNAGPDPANNTVVTYTLPAGVTLVSATPSGQGSIGRSGNFLFATLGTVAPNSNATLTLVVYPNLGTPLVLSASVKSDQSDPNPANNTVSQTAIVPRPTTPGDYDGDGRTDVAAYFPSAAVYAYRPSTGTGDVLQSFGVVGAGQTIPSPGDYFGDGKVDVAVYLPAFGAFAIRPTSGGPDVVIPFGIPGVGQTIPAPGDYDGDGKTDIAAYLPSAGVFVYRPSSGGADVVEPFGVSGAGQTIPAPGDYDGDGKTDIAAYLPEFGSFAVRLSSGGADVIVPFGVPGAGQTIPVPGDYNGDGKTDIAAYLPAFGSFAIRPSTGGPDVVVPFGFAGAGQTIPAPGDYDGDGRTDIAAYLPSVGVFAIRPSSGLPDVIEPFGIPGPGMTVPASSLPDAVPNPPGVVSAASVASGLILPMTDDLMAPSKRKASIVVG